MIEYELEMQETTLTNYIVVTDKAKTNKPDDRARMFQLTSSQLIFNPLKYVLQGLPNSKGQ